MLHDITCFSFQSEGWDTEDSKATDKQKKDTNTLAESENNKSNTIKKGMVQYDHCIILCKLMHFYKN